MTIELAGTSGGIRTAVLEKLGESATQWLTSYQSIGVGEMSSVSDNVERVIGRPLRTFAEFLSAHPKSYAHLGTR